MKACFEKKTDHIKWKKKDRRSHNMINPGKGHTTVNNRGKHSRRFERPSIGQEWKKHSRRFERSSIGQEKKAMTWTSSKLLFTVN